MANICSAKQNAIKEGKDTYFTGKPCKRGHLSHRRTSNSICIDCSKEVYHTTDRDNYRYKDTFYRQFLSRKQKANKAGIPFTIEYSDLEKPEYCPVFNIKLNYGWSGEDRRDIAKATIDRLIPELGYIPGNVFVISWRANILKSNMTLDELKMIQQYIEEKANGKDVRHNKV